ncbi:XRE family transcriptional regulator [Streptomyces sp. NPDC006430]|uniref:XRE family transcriptional regulator n=1 Tax=Streptomyces sp. NPDC006430 TaxID=3154299 RepID=UPI0033AB0926
MNVFQARVDPELVIAWESDANRPTEQQLFALADVLWCSTSELMGIEMPRTLGELRLARQFSVVRLAQSIGMDASEYMRAEERNRWAGSRRQTLDLLSVLNISLHQLADATGRSHALGTAFSFTARMPRWSRLWPGKPAAPAAGAHEQVVTSAEAE